MEQAIRKTLQNIRTALPIVAGILMLINLLNPLLAPFYTKVFTGNYLIDPLIGTIIGTLSFGIPVVSYVTGGLMIKAGVSLIAVTAFILSWSTVNFVMFPLEAASLGKRFAIYRNSFNFISAIIIAILTILALKLLA